MNTYTQNNVMTVSDMRLRPHEVLARSQEEPVFLFHRSKPKAIMMSVEEYIRIQDELEDLELSVKAQKYEYERETFNKNDWLSLDEIKEKYKNKK